MMAAVAVVFPVFLAVPTIPSFIPSIINYRLALMDILGNVARKTGT
jgi:hypothetical protein